MYCMVKGRNCKGFLFSFICRKQQTSARSFSVLEISKSRKGFQLKGKQLNQVAVQTLCILLDMNKHNATNQIGYPDSAEQRIAFGLSRDAPIISVYASSLFQTQSYYLLLLREIVQDCVFCFVVRLFNRKRARKCAIMSMSLYQRMVSKTFLMCSITVSRV